MLILLLKIPRFIPAHAGNTADEGKAAWGSAVHPRPRGEHACWSVVYRLTSGSSPPTRGTPLPPRMRTGRDRFIPAHAGNTATSHPGDPSCAVHPRPRGEHELQRQLIIALAGSSPPTRGTLAQHCVTARAVRFIPAHAGNTASRSNASCTCAVHPRPRGEHRVSSSRSSSSTGSSPPTRGTPARRPPGCQSVRFIPAHAGNTAAKHRVLEPAAVHPRPRGEHAPLSFTYCSAAGSSPPTRGTPADGLRARVARRFIPAHAGNTGGWRHAPIPTAVHPRPRGEHGKIVAAYIVVRGSSPPTRGTLLPAHIRKANARFIPAHAGNTAASAHTEGECAVHPRPRGEHTYRKPLIQKQKIGPQKSTDLPPGKSSRQCLTARSRRSTPPCRRSPPRPARGYRSRSPGTAC